MSHVRGGVILASEVNAVNVVSVLAPLSTTTANAPKTGEPRPMSLGYPVTLEPRMVLHSDGSHDIVAWSLCAEEVKNG